MDHPPTPLHAGKVQCRVIESSELEKGAPEFEFRVSHSLYDLGQALFAH